MALKSVADLIGRCQKMEHALGPKEQGARLLKVGAAVKPVATATAAGDLGSDAAFSGWKHGTIPLTISYKLHRDGYGLTIHRGGASAGPWRVAEVGRNNSNAAGFSGPGLNRKTGVTNRTGKGRLRKVSAFRGGSKWSGHTAGKRTWSKAGLAMGPVAVKVLSTSNRKAVVNAFLGN